MKIIEPDHKRICNYMRSALHCSRCGEVKKRRFDYVCYQCFEHSFARWKECYATAKNDLTTIEYTLEELAAQDEAHKRSAEVNAKAMQELHDILSELI